MFLRRPKVARIAILGCGPTGLFTAHAFASLGFSEISILSRKRRSEMFGAQYLHEPIPGLSEEEGTPITYSLRGTPEQYARKVYDGKLPAFVTSPALLPERQIAYDIRRAYFAAWDRYADRITNVRVQPSMMVDIQRGFDIVVSTIPARDLCNQTCGDVHRFDVQKVYAIGDAPERGVFCPIIVQPWTVECNGEENPRWYRASNVFGYKTAEWPGSNPPPVADIAVVEKPIGTNCDCWTDHKGFMRAGRFGTWTKGVLSHQAYYDVMEAYQ